MYFHILATTVVLFMLFLLIARGTQSQFSFRVLGFLVFIIAGELLWGIWR